MVGMQHLLFQELLEMVQGFNVRSTEGIKKCSVQSTNALQNDTAAAAHCECFGLAYFVMC